MLYELNQTKHGLKPTKHSIKYSILSWNWSCWSSSFFSELLGSKSQINMQATLNLKSSMIN
uniref:Uncharacterized protein n=1 Tax=Arundo donax TaxID=35708 RepID=A0A0A9C9Q4_ARUDO